MSLFNPLKSSVSSLSKDTRSSASKAVTSSQLAPALAGAATGLNAFGKEKLGPAMEYAGDGMKKAGGYLMENAGPAMNKTGTYVRNNPGKSALWAVSAASVLVPGAFVGPVLGVLGWGSAGVKAGELSFYFFFFHFLCWTCGEVLLLEGTPDGSAAAAIQASIGNVAAGSVFATLQSAGVVGSVAVNGVVQAAGVVTGLVNLRNSTGNGDAEISEVDSTDSDSDI
ncbi:hypothetical protein VTL71DRAFT_2467 [Oculimacula yallundae]|uniref:Uncharacterized protein n=1 Tax=Oculimacula yallundae TaxID=86028 RepID=A0ABR4CAB0_9HELO